mmetsp:Transcript_24646/g.45943  ORF Transcript_24646/g.45943 Transcript_24646/m.45943 type:complete len:385 (+) Transcript_24646:90-1244(+)
MSAADSHVLDIRKKTAQERLRGDHIELLYQLEDATKLNDRYEKEIELLKQQLADSHKPESVIVVEESGEIIDGHVRTIESLQESLAELTTEVKTMKTKEVLSQKSFKKKIEAMQDQLDSKEASEAALRASYEQRKNDLQELLSSRPSRGSEPSTTTQPQLCPGNSNNTLELEQKCAELEKQVKELTVAALEKDKELEDEREASRQRAEAHAVEVQNKQDTYLKQKSVILELEHEKSLLSSQLLEAESRADELEAKLAAEERSTAALLASIPATVLSPFKPVETTATLESSTQTDDVTVAAPAKQGEKDAAMANQFKDYVALKKEIMTLKLQLAHKESGKPGRRHSGSGVGMGDKQTSNSMLASNKSASSMSQTQIQNPAQKKRW